MAIIVLVFLYYIASFKTQDLEVFMWYKLLHRLAILKCMF